MCVCTRTWCVHTRRLLGKGPLASIRSQRINSMTQKVIKKLFFLIWVLFIELDTYPVGTFLFAYYTSIKSQKKKLRSSRVSQTSFITSPLCCALLIRLPFLLDHKSLKGRDYAILTSPRPSAGLPSPVSTYYRSRPQPSSVA